VPGRREAVEEVTANCAGVALHRSIAWLPSNLSSAEEAATVMMGIKTRNFSPLENVSLEELIPKDNFYRCLEEKLDLSLVGALLKDRYAVLGRPSVETR
jgi:hypothetical protein